jgi:feruloyl esterase
MNGRHDGAARTLLIAAAVVALHAASVLPAASATCDELNTLPLSGGAVTGATNVAPGAFGLPDGAGVPVAAPFASAPAFCRVTATLRPTHDSEIRIEVWLPAVGWNGKFQAVGNGDWAGAIPYSSLARAVTAGYASAGTDTGHTGNTAAFAPGHPEKVIDMAYRAVHEMTVHAKAIIAAYYGSPATLSLWNACSTGGRQGVTSAVRYPTDFDAIVAGAPAVDWMRLHTGRIALNRTVNKTPAHVIPREKYGMIHAAVLNACDALDGVRDGVLENPRACTFDPQVLQCKGKDGADCLSVPQVETARAFYSPVTHPVTGEVVMPGLERGTELSWAALGGPQPLGNAVEAFRHVVHENPNWDWRRFDLATDVALGDTVHGGVLASAEANLKPFFDRGGKLLMYHGWNDPLIPPGNTIGFFDRVVETAGRDAVGTSVQLYMLPGMNHCGGGTGTDSFNQMRAIERWLETGQAPSRITASRIVNGIVERTRPLCPYGQTAFWDGRGNPDDAESFACVAGLETPTSGR